MDVDQIAGLLNTNLGAGTAMSSDILSNPPCLIIGKNKILKACELLKNDPSASYEMLECISGIDNGLEAGTMEVIYHLCSISRESQIALRVILPRPVNSEDMPEIESISSLWGTAEWLERETFDLLGINFTGNPDLRRILLPSDWKGFPLRKDYKTEEYFHHVKIEY